MDRTLHDTLTNICHYLDGLISRNRLEDHLIFAFAQADTMPPAALDALQLVQSKLSGNELKARLDRIVRNANQGVYSYA